MSGRPAETWRKFTFSTAPAWTYALLVLVCLGIVGIIVFAIVLSAVSIKATGHLPLTRSSRRTANLVIWAPASLILGSFALMTAVAVAAFSNVDAGDPNAGAVGGLLFLVGIFALVAGLVGRLLVGPLVLPRGKVEQLPGYYDRVVELRHLHPAFVAAVLQRQQASQAQQPDAPLSS